jgi:NADPH:quinone reductase-like Zn-dependent oxidoreductase
VVFDVIGGEILERSAALVRAGGTLVTIAEPVAGPPPRRAGRLLRRRTRPARLADLAQRLRDGRLKPIVGAVRPLAEAPPRSRPDKRTPGKTIIRVTDTPRPMSYV